MENQRYDLRSQYLKIFLVVFIYWFISIGTVFVNETLWCNKSVALDAPIFIVWFQCIVSFTICFCMSRSGGIPGLCTFPEGSPWDIEVFKIVIPVTVMYTLMTATNSLCLHYHVSFYSIGSSLTTVFTVVLSWALLDKMTSVMCKSCCLVIVIGFCLGVDRENLLEIWLLLYYNSAYSIILFIPLIFASGEMAILWNYTTFEIVEWLDLYFWVKMALGGVCGLCIGYITTLQIKVTSPLTHNISDTAKTCVQMVIATHWYHEPKSGLWWTSNLIILCSCAIYALIKHIEIEDNSRKPQPEEQTLIIFVSKENLDDN